MEYFGRGSGRVAALKCQHLAEVDMPDVRLLAMRPKIYSKSLSWKLLGFGYA